jgi:hypothetical protein
MQLRAAGLVVCAMLILSGMASAATAAPADLVGANDQSVATTPFTAPIPHKTYTFDNKGRWGVKLDVEEPTNRETEWKDVTAGAYFRIGPRLKLGGSVGLGDKFAQPQQITPQDVGPRVHLETKFQF